MGDVVVVPEDFDPEDEAELLEQVEADRAAAEKAAAAGPPAGEPATVEELRAQIEKLQGAVRRNNGELAKRRTIGAQLQKLGIDDLEAWMASNGFDPATGQRAQPAPAAAPAAPAEPAAEPDPAAPPAAAAPPSAPSAPPAPDPAIRDLQAKLEAGTSRIDKLTTAVRDSAINAALRGARFSGDTKRAMRLLNLENITVGDDGTVSGLDTEISTLQTDFPEMFAPRRPGSTPPPPPPRGGDAVDGGDKRPAPPANKLKWDQALNAKLSGRS